MSCEVMQFVIPRARLKTVYRIGGQPLLVGDYKNKKFIILHNDDHFVL